MKSNIKAINPGKKKNAVIKQYAIYIVFAILCVVMVIAAPGFASFINVMNILKQVAIVTVIAFGSSMVLISGEIDLSPGAVCAFSGCVAASLAHPGEFPLFVPIVMSVAVGVLCGFGNGFLTAKARVPSFIVTLGTATALRGITLLYTNGAPISNLSEQFKFFGGGSILGVPLLGFILIGVFLVMFYIMEKTKFGRHVYAVGGNEKATFLSGINTQKIKIIVFMIAGLLAGFSGALLASRVNAGSPIAGRGYELDAIAAAVIGGISISGGVGKIYGTLVGALLLTVITNGLDMLGVSSYYQDIISGVIIIAAVYMDVRGKRNK